MPLKNQYGYGDDRYPKTINACLLLLNCWTPSGQQQQKSPCPSRGQNNQKKEKDDNKALVFAQNANKNSGSATSNAMDDSSATKSVRAPYQKKPTNVRCHKCNKLGHTSAVCPDSKPPEQVHTISAGINDASVASDASSIIILAQQGGQEAIDPNYLLLDSQSTINLFSNPNHVDNVHPATQPIKVHCNKGVMPTDNIADFGHNVVYVNPNGIANVLSLYLLGQRHHITYDSKDRGGVYKVHTSRGVLEFTPTPSGLHVLNLK
jgi:hypothetical protein